MARRTLTLVALPLSATALAVVMSTACGSSSSGGGATFDASPTPSSTVDAGGPGTGFGPGSDGGSGGGGTEAGVPGTLTALIRDFKLYDKNDPSTNPDFENVPSDGTNGPWDDHGIVDGALGADGTPVYKSSTTTTTTHGKAAFAQWYHDVPGTNLRVDYPLPLTTNADGTMGYDSEVSGIAPGGTGTKGFFPINDGTPYATAFGDQGDPANYSFTVELHTLFTYSGGEFFHYRGDDDVWVFIDKKLAIDLGGIHAAEPSDVNVDSLGLTKGKEYTLDVFFAERHKTGSNLLFTTSLALRPAPPK